MYGGLEVQNKDTTAEAHVNVFCHFCWFSCVFVIYCCYFYLLLCFWLAVVLNFVVCVMFLLFVAFLIMALWLFLAYLKNVSALTSCSGLLHDNDLIILSHASKAFQDSTVQSGFDLALIFSFIAHCFSFLHLSVSAEATAGAETTSVCRITEFPFSKWAALRGTEGINAQS